MKSITHGPAKLSFVDEAGVEHEIVGTVTVTADDPPPAVEPGGVVLRCGVCGLPWARLEDGTLVVESRHGGEVHVNRISVAALSAMVGDTVGASQYLPSTTQYSPCRFGHVWNWTSASTGDPHSSMRCMCGAKRWDQRNVDDNG